MPRLYEIAEDVRAQFMLAEESEDPGEALALLQDIQGFLEQRVHVTALRVQELRREQENVRSEIERLRGHLKTTERQEEWLKNYILVTLQKADMRRVDGDFAKARRQKVAPSVMVGSDLEAMIEQGADIREVIDPAFVRVIPERYELDKKAIIDAYKAGATLPDGVAIDDTKEIVVVW